MFATKAFVIPVKGLKISHFDVKVNFDRGSKRTETKQDNTCAVGETLVNDFKLAINVVGTI